MSAVFASLLGTASVDGEARAEPAGASPMTAEPTSWVAGGFELGGRDGEATEDFGTISVSQPSYAFTLRGTLWNPASSTALGHMPAMDVDLRAGWWGASEGLASAASRRREEEGGFWLVTKTTYPWAIIDSKFFRLGAGFGFGIGFELDTWNPGEEIDLDFCLHGKAVVYPTGSPEGLAIDVGYDFGLVGLSYETQHRLRASVLLGALVLGVRFHHTSFGEQGSAVDLAGMLGWNLL
jgi:hypothetical protein